MIPVPGGVRVWLASGVTDMRRGMNTLALQVQEDLGHDPHAGDLYIFRGRRGDLVKILWSDGVGTSLYAKRLERGRFQWPVTSGGAVSISAAQLGYPRPARRRTTLSTRASRHHSPASPDGLPERRDPEAEMVRGRRACPQAGGNQDRPTTGLAERSGAGHHRPPAAYGQRLCLSVPEISGKTVFQRYGPVVPSEEGSRDR